MYSNRILDEFRLVRITHTQVELIDVISISSQNSKGWQATFPVQKCIVGPVRPCQNRSEVDKWIRKANSRGGQEGDGRKKDYWNTSQMYGDIHLIKVVRSIERQMFL